MSVLRRIEEEEAEEEKEEMSNSINTVPKWLETMMSANFFEYCTVHDKLKRNERNNFCVDCLSRYCPYCLLDHPNQHQIIHVRRHRESALIKTEDMEMLINCESIQSFSLNRAVVLYLNKREQGQSSSRVSYYCYCGHTLSRKYRYCSIACKLQAFEKGEASIDRSLDSPDAPPLLLPAPPADRNDDVAEENRNLPPETIPDEPTNAAVAAGNAEGSEPVPRPNAGPSSSRRSSAGLRSRKGTPRRSPFF